MAADTNSRQAYIVYYEDWTGGEQVTIINTTVPDNVTNLTAADVRATSVTLSWSPSPSPDVTGYEVLNGTDAVGTTSGTTYQVTGLAGETTNTFTVKAKNAAGNVSSGSALTVTTPKPSYALSMNGTSDYFFTPTLTFDTVVMDFAAEPKAGAYSSYLDASRGIANSAFLHTSSGSDLLQAAWKTLLVNGTDQTAALKAGSSAVIPANQRVTVQLQLPSTGKSAVYIFANQLGQTPMKGTLYALTFTLNGKAVAAYDFTQPSPGTAIPDRSGNNQTATLKGGTWIA